MIRIGRESQYLPYAWFFQNNDGNEINKMFMRIYSLLFGFISTSFVSTLNFLSLTNFSVEQRHFQVSFLYRQFIIVMALQADLEELHHFLFSFLYFSFYSQLLMIFLVVISGL